MNWKDLSFPARIVPAEIWDAKLFMLAINPIAMMYITMLVLMKIIGLAENVLLVVRGKIGEVL